MTAKHDHERAKQITGLFDELMRVLGRESGGSMVRLFVNLDLNLPQMLSIDMMALGPQTVSGIAEELQLTRGAVSRLVDQLVRKGLVSRVEGASDRRTKELKLTAQGKRTAERLERSRTGNFAALVAQVSPDLQEEFRSVLERVVAELRQKRRAETSGK